VDHGDRPVRVDAANPLCLVGANLAVARRVFQTVGTFAPAVQRVKDNVGSSEDHEFLLRLFDAGQFGMYDPDIVIHAAVQADRLDRAYHRRWHSGHGHFHALMRIQSLEQSQLGRLFDVPAHLYRSAAQDLTRWIAATARRNEVEAFDREMRLRFFWGFFTTRRRHFRSLPRHERRLHWRDLARNLLGRRREDSGSSALTHGAHR
jgi:hypothetical protein